MKYTAYTAEATETYDDVALTEETAELYAEALENGSYDEETYATNDGRMVTIVNPDEHSNYRYHLRSVDGRYISKAKTTDEAIKFLMTGEYIDCYDGKAKVW